MKKINWCFYSHFPKSDSLDPAMETEFFHFVEEFAAIGGNMLVMTCTSEFPCESHPEVSYGDCPYTKNEIYDTVLRIKRYGVTPIPCAYLSRQNGGLGISTPEYHKYAVDRMAEIKEVFDNPPLLHVALDEEGEEHESHRTNSGLHWYRNGELWWHDNNYLFDNAMKMGMRPWIWSDRIWFHRDEFLQKMSRDVLQSNWYYGTYDKEDPKHPLVKSDESPFLDLNEYGFDQIPCGSTWDVRYNMQQMVSYLTPKLEKNHLKGYLMAPWVEWSPEGAKQMKLALEMMRQAKDIYESLQIN